MAFRCDEILRSYDKRYMKCVLVFPYQPEATIATIQEPTTKTTTTINNKRGDGAKHRTI